MERIDFNQDQVQNLVKAFLCPKHFRLKFFENYWCKRFYNVFQDFELGIKKSSVNWIIFLFPLPGLVFHKLWKQAFLIFLLAFILSFLLAITIILLYTMGFSHTFIKVVYLFLFLPLITIFFVVVPAVKFDYWLYKKFKDLYIKTNELPFERRIEIMQRYSPNLISTLLAIIIPSLFLIVFLLFLISSNYYHYYL